MKGIEYSTKQMIGYFIITNRYVKKNRPLTMKSYIITLINKLEKVEQNDILKTIDLSLLEDLFITPTLNEEEIFYYGIVLFDRLLNYYNREFTEIDIVNETEIVMRIYSTRTIMYAADDVINRLKDLKIKLSKTNKK